MIPAAADVIASEIIDIGEQTRQVAARYEDVFIALRNTFNKEVASATRPADGALAVMAVADVAASAFLEHLPNQPPRDCRAGCEACCHLYVMTPPGVADAIGEFLTERLDRAALAELRIGLQETANAAAGLTDPKSLRRRCPLLGADGLCTIYEVRPPACRAFTSGSVAACRSLAFESKGAVSSIRQNPSQYRVFVEATAALEQSWRIPGMPSGQVGLAEALLAVLPETGGDA